MVAAIPLRSLPLLAGIALLGAACSRSEKASLGTESGALPPDSAAPTAAPVADFKSVAAKIVGQSAGVNEGDIVLITGSDEDLPLLEEVAIEVREARRLPARHRRHHRLQPPDLRRGAREVRQPAARGRPQARRDHRRVHRTESGEGRTLKGVPPERMAARGKAFAPVGQLMTQAERPERLPRQRALSQRGARRAVRDLARGAGRTDVQRCGHRLRPAPAHRRAGQEGAGGRQGAAHHQPPTGPTCGSRIAGRPVAGERRRHLGRGPARRAGRR